MFGEKVSVEVFNDEEYAIISFKNIFNAYFAQQSLNHYFLTNHNAYLSVKWVPKEQIPDPVQECNPQSEGPYAPLPLKQEILP
jgi:hypothetical protein